MAKIIGNTTTTPYPRPDWNQTDPTKADYIKNKPDIGNAKLKTITLNCHPQKITADIYTECFPTDKGIYLLNYPVVKNEDQSSNYTTVMMVTNEKAYDAGSDYDLYNYQYYDVAENKWYEREIEPDYLDGFDNTTWEAVSVTPSDLSETLNERIKFVEVNGTDEQGQDILWQNHSWFNGVKDETFNSQLPTSLEYEDYGLYVIKYWTGGMVSPQTLLLNYGDYYNNDDQETLYQTVIDDKGEIYRREMPFPNDELNWEGVAWKKVSSSGGDVNSEELDKRIQYINAWDYVDDEGDTLVWYYSPDLFFKDIYESGIYSVYFNPDGIGGAYGILIVGDEESFDDDDNTCGLITQTFIRDRLIETRYARLSYDTSEYTEWSEWKSLYATSTSVSQIRTSVNNLSKELDKRIKYAHGGEYDADPELFCADIVNPGVYHLRYSKDGITDNNGLLLVSEMADYSNGGIPKLIQTFYGENMCITRWGDFDFDDNEEYIVEKWYEWEDMFATTEVVNNKANKTTISTSISNNTLVLNHNKEARLGERTSLILSMPNTIDERYESYFTFISGAIATNLSYEADTIKWSGDDVDSEGEFTPEPNTIYEVAVKYLGNDVEGNPIISARVGVV